jgi:flavin-dependent dehydrogenase
LGVRAGAQAVAVIGGGPAGALAAERLAAAGHGVTVFDERPGWEKPCGGGVTDKALAAYPFLREAGIARQWVRDCELIGRSGRRARLALDRAIAIFSRETLNRLLLERARRAGAEVVTARVVGLERAGAAAEAPAADLANASAAASAGRGGGVGGGGGESGADAGGPTGGGGARRAGWRLRLREGAEVAADFVILAAGARNPFRHAFGLAGGAADFMTALGYYGPGGGDRIQIRFLPGLDGYIWVFPRVGHFSVGICGHTDGMPAGALRAELDQFLRQEGYSYAGSPFYAHVLPAYTVAALRAMRFSGGDWAVVGDAAGLVDPITGEGLYYALRSGELCAAALLAGRIEGYGRALRAEVLPDLELAARIARRFYTGSFLGGEVIERMIQFTARSRRFQRLMADLFAGSQGYVGLRRRLYRQLAPTLCEAALAHRTHAEA